MTVTADLVRARQSLQGLSVGDAFGELFLSGWGSTPSEGSLPEGPWPWTDDTHMALSIVEILERFGCIEQDALAAAFARRYQADPKRGYAGGAATLLRGIGEGADWRAAARALFDGGSYGNGAAMRAAPIGGAFWQDPARAASEAQRSAVITHAHPEGQAGAMAVAAAAAVAASWNPPEGADFLHAVLPYVPEGLTRSGIEEAAGIAGDELNEAVDRLGTGRNVSAQDTVPFCLWSAAHHLRDFEAALWSAVKGAGDCDTTCAIVGGIVALSAPEVPEAWRARREPLPADEP